MTISRLLLPLFLCCLLIGVIFKLAFAPEASHVGAEPGTVAPKTTAATPPLPAFTSEEAVKVILARPLFAPRRRPLPSSETGHINLPRLTGIITGPGDRKAIFAGEPHSIAISAGGSIEGYTVTSIEAGTVTLSGPVGTMTLHPQRAADNAVTTPSQSTTTAPQSSGSNQPLTSQPDEQPSPAIIDEMRRRLLGTQRTGE
ncbi:hypothetical protein [Granulibacter bethesdensis]|uniref:Type II secretion system protein GspC N-terminal domain-containing protein n=1 Tax=Granulibacter bethesdensis (strain ATCC BAA-1260 / CGDNIH1) TaxID=391165 RepID=Q0BR91_GRABC|nr:hypothetical protein [Granulibacter bethesdensis]ABI62661.1 Hypothetical protein GbCGDNIH1_1763 [Granulibacter bethesdensis CGDNIH1]APH52517.1 Hypothetical protein GbCGDNIH5_1763 [Granulibacter bethesdensis]APH65206.1 Hypothetical protein GbCGDNIH1I4_1763 [Granulibacter bethesdensis]